MAGVTAAVCRVWFYQIMALAHTLTARLDEQFRDRLLDRRV